VKIDERNLAKLRDFTVEKSKGIALDIGDRVLEVGPPRLTKALNSPVFENHPEWFFDFQAYCEKSGARYSSLDIDPDVEPTYLGSLEDSTLDIPPRSFSSIICFSILEHCQDLVSAVDNIAKWLEPEKTVHFLTPWDLRFHGPRPDCWRISDDGYRWLLKKHFNIIEIEYLQQSGRDLSPIAIYVKASRKF
jgi:hypothetical protein